MSPSLVDLASQKRIVFYDELSHLNPVYAAPSDDDPWSLKAEVQYHLRNLRLLSLYFDGIAIMTGNVLNFPNHTTKAVILATEADGFFRSLCEEGIIIFCGWGAPGGADMVRNQLEYARGYRPQLKDKQVGDLTTEIMSSTSILVREESVGEEDFIYPLLDSLRVHAERSPHPDWRRVERAALRAQEDVGHVGTMEFFPHLMNLEPSIRRRSHKLYLDAWIDYASDRYHPVYTYESPRYGLNPYRSARSIEAGERGLSAILLSPHFFERFLLRFLRQDEYVRLLTLPARRLAKLRNGDWRIFCDRYHRHLQESSKVLWKLQVLATSPVGAYMTTAEETYDVFDRVLRGTLTELHPAVDPEVLADFISGAVGIFSAVPGAKKLSSALLRPLADRLAEYLRRFMRGLSSRDLHPFLSKVRAEVA